MNIKCLSLLLTATFLTAQAGMQIGDITFNNTLNQSVKYEYVTKPDGALPGINARPGSVTTRGRGEIAAHSSGNIISSFGKISPVTGKRENIWGSAIDFTLQTDANNSFPAAIAQVGTYDIVLKDGKLSLEKK